MPTKPATRLLRAPKFAAVRVAASAAFPSFGPKSRDVGGAEARRGVGSADDVRIATELSTRSASCSERR